MALIGGSLRGFSFVAITALLINLSGQSKETKALRAIVYPFVP